MIEQDGLTFRDLNNDGLLTPYEDWRLSPEARAEDLAARMTLEEKAGQMVHGTLPGLQGFAGFSSVGYDIDVLTAPVLERNISTFIILNGLFLKLIHTRRPNVRAAGIV